jgi:hypothetical protein
VFNLYHTGKNWASKHMKKIILASMLLAISSIPCFADRTVDVEGSGTVTHTGGYHYQINCDNTVNCCGSIIIYCLNEPTVGDHTVINQCDGSPQNIIHQWVGNFVSMDIETNANNYTQCGIDLSESSQVY